jgi:hypothetical protein
LEKILGANDSGIAASWVGPVKRSGFYLALEFSPEEFVTLFVIKAELDALKAGSVRTDELLGY